MRTLLCLLSLLLFLLCALPCSADDYVPTGNGYYQRGNAYYTRWYQPSYTSYGVYYPSYYYYQFSHYAPATVNVTVVPSVKDKQWKEKLLDVVAARDEHAAYLRALDALGPPSYASTPHSLYAQPSYSHQLTGYHANTYGAGSVYGYSQAAMNVLYGNDPTVNYQQAARLAEQMIDAAKQGNAGFQELIALDNDGRNKASQKLVQGFVAAMALQAAQGNGSSSTGIQQGGQGTTQLQGTPNPPAQQPVAPGTGVVPPLPSTANPSQVRQQYLNQSCLGCHNQNRRERLNLANYEALTTDAKAEVFRRLTSTDPKTQMPRNADGTPGPRAPRDVLQAFLQP